MIDGWIRVVALVELLVGAIEDMLASSDIVGTVESFVLDISGSIDEVRFEVESNPFRHVVFSICLLISTNHGNLSEGHKSNVDHSSREIVCRLLYFANRVSRKGN